MNHVIWTGHVEIGVEYRMIFVVVFLTVKFGHFEKGTKFEKNLPHSIRRYSVASNFKWKIFFSNFVPFSECPNFTCEIHFGAPS